jgi:hypothetical protein
MFFVFSLLNIFGGGKENPTDNPQQMWNDVANTVAPWSTNDWVLAVGSGAIIGLALIMISALFGGVGSYTSYKLSQGESVKLSEAFRVAFDNLWSYIWLQIIVFVKIVLWSLLFIIPGVIMSIRYSLANVAFFDERKHFRGNAAVKESLRLTQGAWITTFSANMLFNFLTLGYLSSIISTGVNAVLYRQFGDLGDKQKPAAHWLSWVTFALPFVLAVFLFIFLVVFLMGVATGFKFSE